MAESKNYKNRSWEPQVEAEVFFTGLLARCCEENEFLADFNRNLARATGIRLRDIVDHVCFGDPAFATQLERAGWSKTQPGIWENASGLFPVFVQRSGPRTLWIRVEDCARFKLQQNIAGDIEGAEYGAARRLAAWEGPSVSMGVFERNGQSGFDVPEEASETIRLARLHAQTFQSRRREFDDPVQGLLYTEDLVDRAIDDLGPHRACDLWLKAERLYWQRFCLAGRRQKSRQDALGVGWCNIDHHTYDGSREHFRHTIRILEKLGYELREMLYAGDLAGWGSQVLEQPVIKSTIFADVDLTPDELDVDFAHEQLPTLDRHRRAGLVSALHGESILEAGLNHVAGLYDWEACNRILREDGMAFMEPFSNSDVLYQELTIGDTYAVAPSRVDVLEAEGHIASAEAETVRLNGAIRTHFENIERNFGYKGFNKAGIDTVLRKLDPRAVNVNAV